MNTIFQFDNRLVVYCADDYSHVDFKFYTLYTLQKFDYKNIIYKDSLFADGSVWEFNEIHINLGLFSITYNNRLYRCK